MKSCTKLILSVCVLWLAAACDPARPVKVERAAPPATPNVRPVNDHEGHPEVDAPRITLADAKKDYDSKTAVFIDTPANRLDEYIDKIPKGKKLILYCS